MYPIIESSFNSSSKTNAKEPQPSTSSVVALTFSPDQDIDFAFIRLSAEIKRMIENCNTLQVACIEKASSPKSLMSMEIISKIKAVETFKALCSMLADTTYWNFLDTRMMEAMVTVSMIPAAQQMMENFKRVYFKMKLSDVVPYIPVIPLKLGYTKIQEVIDKDPRNFTIEELHKHRFYLETELFKTGNNTIQCYKIMIGSVAIVWLIHVNDVYQAYTSLKNQTPSPAIVYLTIPRVQEWIGIPNLWRGQNIEKIGPIEPLSGSITHNPLELPKQFEWTLIDSNNFDEIMELNKNHKDLQGFDESQLMEWLVLHPYFKKNFFFGIRKFTDKKLIGWIYLQPLHIVINGKSYSIIQIRTTWYTGDITLNPSLQNILYREIIRIAYLNKIYQIMIELQYPEIIKPISTLILWRCIFSEPFLPGSLKTVGLRKMTAKDIPSALALTNQYTSQFEIGQIFQTEEEFSHYFFNLSLPDFVSTYVVEDPSTGSITDMFSFRLLKNRIDRRVLASVYAIVVTKTPPRQLITDILVCAQKEGANVVNTYLYGLSKEYFDNLFIKLDLNAHMHLLNYNYPKVDEEKCCLFLHFI